jgi:hypothetical protein
MLVVNAHRVTEDGGEGFAVRLYRRARRRGPLVAFSDAPHAFRGGFSKVGEGGEGRHAEQSSGLLGMPTASAAVCLLRQP